MTVSASTFHLTFVRNKVRWKVGARLLTRCGENYGLRGKGGQWGF